MEILLLNRKEKKTLTDSERPRVGGMKNRDKRARNVGKKLGGRPGKDGDGTIKEENKNVPETTGERKEGNGKKRIRKKARLRKWEAEKQSMRR